MANKKKRDLSNFKTNKKYKNLTELLKETQKLTLGKKWADRVTKFTGSWAFIFIIITFLFVYILINAIALIYRWDPYPFILLNLILAVITAIQAPIILMSQNRQADRDSIKTERDHIINLKEEREVTEIQKSLNQIKRLINKKNLRKGKRKKR